MRSQELKGLVPYGFNFTVVFTDPNNKFFWISQITRCWGIFLDVTLNVRLPKKRKLVSKRKMFVRQQNDTHLPKISSSDIQISCSYQQLLPVPGKPAVLVHPLTSVEQQLQKRLVLHLKKKSNFRFQPTPAFSQIV